MAQIDVSGARGLRQPATTAVCGQRRMARHSNNPKRRIAPKGQFTSKQLEKLEATMTYEGSGHHKRRPVDYGFSSVNPRPWKSLCDRERGISIHEAKELFENGIRRGMISAFFKDERPKYVWAVEFGWGALRS